jgi:hypothetical protein
MKIRLTACSFDMDRPKSVRNARREPQPDRRFTRAVGEAYVHPKGVIMRVTPGRSGAATAVVVRLLRVTNGELRRANVDRFVESGAEQQVGAGGLLGVGVVRDGGFGGRSVDGMRPGGAERGAEPPGLGAGEVDVGAPDRLESRAGAADRGPAQ